MKEMECAFSFFFFFSKNLATDCYGSYVNKVGISGMHQAVANTLVGDIDKAVLKSPALSFLVD